MTENTYNYVAENVKRIQNDIAEACIKYGRDPLDVTLMGVSKTQPVEKLIVAKEAGITVFGENKVQELIRKADFFKRNNVPCHIIGTLQTNKVKYIIDKVDMIHSLDSIKLAKEIDSRANKIGKVMDVLVEVNSGREENKSGIFPEEVPSFLSELTQFPNG